MTARPVASYLESDERGLEELRSLAPQNPWRRSTRFLWLFEGRGPLDRLCRCISNNHCGYCGRRAGTRSVVVNPITFRRSYIALCGRRRCSKKLRTWEGQADSRRRRAQYDWERQNPEAAPLALIGHIPPQYPSVSRATLRAFLDSGEDVATVDGCLDPSRLNGSIKSLGFADEVYAELRSGQAVLRRGGPGKAVAS